ncbi:MAG: signal peptidase II [Oscillibacter sp.]|jgi:lipoprotein signal peptidase|uniref:signal peptidase II n=1 Tax=uncultured Oscillibacter sp. TaxID=876091 RepID=UPI00217350B3|nr:signal peptidase II [uncultured Oscillibacter sp.]MCI9644510.1 signal peptidase II [Oscillibacter sp.]
MKTALAALAAYSGCAAARRYLDRASSQERSFLEGRVRLKVLWNEGAAFGLPIPAEALPLASAAALGLLWARRKRCPLGTGLMLGGGASNLRERLAEGRVCDYLQFPRAPGPWNRYAFNLADLCVFSGGALCLLRGGKGSRPS